MTLHLACFGVAAVDVAPTSPLAAFDAAGRRPADDIARARVLGGAVDRAGRSATGDISRARVVATGHVAIAGATGDVASARVGVVAVDFTIGSFGAVDVALTARRAAGNFAGHASGAGTAAATVAGVDDADTSGAAGADAAWTNERIGRDVDIGGLHLAVHSRSVGRRRLIERPCPIGAWHHIRRSILFRGRIGAVGRELGQPRLVEHARRQDHHRD